MINKLIRRKQGFTLIELLVVVVIFIVLSTISLNILLTVLKGSLKAQVTKDVKQSGDYAIQIMTRMIRNAQSLESVCAGSSSSIKIKNPDEGETEFLCDYTQNYISSASAHLDPTPTPAPITSTDLTLVSGQCFFSCSQPTGKPPIISINFTLAKDSATFRAEEQISIDFKTKAALRTY